MPYAPPDANPDAQELLRELRAAADELRAATKAAEEAREIKERKGEEETGGVRNAVLWDQDRARHKAVEQAQLEKYMSWNTY